MDFVKDLGYLAIASRMKRLTDRFMRDASHAYKSLGIDFEPRWFTVFYLLYTKNTSLPISEIAHSLKVSHPAVIQTTQMIIKKGLIKSFQDRRDRRVRRLVLTEKGKELAESLIPVWEDFEKVTSEIFENAGVDMLDSIQRIEVLLGEEGVSSRIIKRIKKRQIESVEILDYMPEYTEYFRELNYQWLEKYFQVEELDKKILQNPEKEIIRKGGQVLFARLGDEIVGTAALLKLNEESYEIAKMAVTEKAQGKQVGRKLTEEAISRAGKIGAKVLLVRTDIRLRAAVNLYRSVGFEVTQTEAAARGKYERDRFGIQMKLELG